MSKKKKYPIQNAITRRRFLSATLAAGAAPMLLSSRLLGSRAPSRTLNLACVGIGNRGGRLTLDLGRRARARVVAVCDVHLNHNRTKEVGEVFREFPNARRFHDFRVMLDEMDGDIDAVSIGTPDHSHFPIAMLAMSKGKHVFVEKPMANTFQEAELMMRAARNYGVVTQMGNQGHSEVNYYQHKAFSEAGLFDGVSKIISYFNRQRRWHSWHDDGPYGYPEATETPEGLHWDLWHTTVEERAFSPRFHPGNWRGWYRYGMGALGDWGPHILDTAHRFLNLGLPTQVELIHVKGHNSYFFPLETTLKFDFPARGDQPPLELFWYDGAENRPQEQHVTGEVGRVLYSGKYNFFAESRGRPLRVVPEEQRREVQSTLPSFERGETDHFDNFILSALGEEDTRSPFEVAGPLNQVFNLGVIAQELGVSSPLIFDSATKQFTNNESANRLLAGPPPRKGWDEYYRL